MYMNLCRNKMMFSVVRHKGSNALLRDVLRVFSVNPKFQTLGSEAVRDVSTFLLCSSFQ